LKYLAPNPDLGHRRTRKIQELGRSLLQRSRLLRSGLRHHQQASNSSPTQSFENIESWITEFLNQGAPKEPEKFPFILVGNKIDREDEREVEESSVTEFLEKHSRIKHLTTSAKNRQGVETAFEKIALASIENKVEEMYV